MTRRYWARFAFSIPLVAGVGLQFLLHEVWRLIPRFINGLTTTNLGVLPGGQEFRTLSYKPWFGWTVVVIPFLAFAAALWLYRMLALQMALEHDTRCRHCDHILRGLTEPRCPECGEPI